MHRDFDCHSPGFRFLDLLPRQHAIADVLVPHLDDATATLAGMNHERERRTRSIEPIGQRNSNCAICSSLQVKWPSVCGSLILMPSVEFSFDELLGHGPLHKRVAT